MKKFDIWLTFVQVFIDFLAVVFGILIAYFIRMFGYDILNFEAPVTLVPLFIQFKLSLQIAFFIVLVLGINGRYNLITHFKSKNFLQLFWSFSAGLSLIVVFFFFSKLHFFSRLIFGLAWVFGFLFLVAGEFVLDFLKKKCWQKGIGKIKIILLGSGKLAKKIKDYLDKKEQFELVKHLTESQFKSLQKNILDLKPDEILMASEKTDDIKVADLAHLAHLHHVQFSFAPDELALDLASVQPFQITGMPLLQLNPTKLSGWGKITKELFDRTFALFALIGLSPVLLIICGLIWKEDRELSFIYKSPRVGKNGELFDCYKFRSMILNADKKKKALLKKNEKKGGVLFKMKNDPRVTNIGKILRKWSLDELPQLFNVLKGDMSLIGPRPHLPEEVAKYSEKQRYLFNIKPGITGLTQIQKNESEKFDFDQEMKVELFYLKNWNLWLDIVIFVKTIGIIVKGKNF